MAQAIVVSGIGPELWKGVTVPPDGRGALDGPAQKPFQSTGFNGLYQSTGKLHEGRPVFAFGTARIYVGKSGHWSMSLNGESSMMNNKPNFEKSGLVRSAGKTGATKLPHMVDVWQAFNGKEYVAIQGASAKAASGEPVKEAALQDMLQAQKPIHLISTPFEQAQGRAKAEALKKEKHAPPGAFCYNPNVDAPQEGGGGWMASWFRVCDKTKETGGTVFIAHNGKKNGKFGDGSYKGWFDGSAQQGEVEQAQRIGCKIEFVPY